MTTLNLNHRQFLQSTMLTASVVALGSRWSPTSAASPVLTVDTRTIEVNNPVGHQQPKVVTPTAKRQAVAQACGARARAIGAVPGDGR